MKLLNGLIPSGASAGIWTFGKYVNMTVKWGKVNKNWRQMADLGVEEIHSNAALTNIESALARSTRGWEKPDPKMRRNLILLTDGQVDIGKDEAKNAKSRQAILDKSIKRLQQAGVRVYAIALSKNADEVLLKRLALETDGSFEIAEKAETIEDESFSKISKHYRADEFEIYNRLARLFQVIDKGDEKLNVPIYNGGLFITDVDQEDESAEAVNARFLCECAIPDRYFTQAIDLMARDVDDKRQDLVFIDYKSLGVRQLGSMYEGLLEFRLRLAPEKMAIVKGKKTEEVVTYKEAISKKRKILKTGKGKTSTERILPKGRVYLENDKKEKTVE